MAFIEKSLQVLQCMRPGGVQIKDVLRRTIEWFLRCRPTATRRTEDAFYSKNFDINYTICLELLQWRVLLQLQRQLAEKERKCRMLDRQRNSVQLFGCYAAITFPLFSFFPLGNLFKRCVIFNHEVMYFLKHCVRENRATVTKQQNLFKVALVPVLIEACCSKVNHWPWLRF